MSLTHIRNLICLFQNLLPFPFLTGITANMVVGKTINSSTVSQFLDGVDLIVARNAQFDRVFFEKTFPNISAKPWDTLYA